MNEIDEHLVDTLHDVERHNAAADARGVFCRHGRADTSRRRADLRFASGIDLARQR